MSKHGGLTIGLALFALLAAGAAFATERHALLGTWTVDISRMEQPDRPKSVTLVLNELEGGKFEMSVHIEAPDGQVVHAGGAFKPDGSAMRVEGSGDVDVVSMSMPNSRTLVMGSGFQGHPASSRVWTLSDDGKEMIEIAIRHLPDGTPYARKFYWKRK